MAQAVKFVVLSAFRNAATESSRTHSPPPQDINTSNPAEAPAGRASTPEPDKSPSKKGVGQKAKEDQFGQKAEEDPLGRYHSLFELSETSSASSSSISQGEASRSPSPSGNISAEDSISEAPSSFYTTEEMAYSNATKAGQKKRAIEHTPAAIEHTPAKLSDMLGHRVNKKQRNDSLTVFFDRVRCCDVAYLKDHCTFANNDKFNGYAEYLFVALESLSCMNNIFIKYSSLLNKNPNKIPSEQSTAFLKSLRSKEELLETVIQWASSSLTPDQLDTKPFPSLLQQLNQLKKYCQEIIKTLPNTCLMFTSKTDQKGHETVYFSASGNQQKVLLFLNILNTKFSSIQALPANPKSDRLDKIIIEYRALATFCSNLDQENHKENLQEMRISYQKSMESFYASPSKYYESLKSLQTDLGQAKFDSSLLVGKDKVEVATTIQQQIKSISQHPDIIQLFNFPQLDPIVTEELRDNFIIRWIIIPRSMCVEHNIPKEFQECERSYFGIQKVNQNAENESVKYTNSSLPIQQNQTYRLDRWRNCLHCAGLIEEKSRILNERLSGSSTLESRFSTVALEQ